jgi:hypothetical protein
LGGVGLEVATVGIYIPPKHKQTLAHKEIRKT